MINGELIVDNFAGGGGASTGIELATGYSVDYCNQSRSRGYQDAQGESSEHRALLRKCVGG